MTAPPDTSGSQDEQQGGEEQSQDPLTAKHLYLDVVSGKVLLQGRQPHVHQHGEN